MAKYGLVGRNIDYSFSRGFFNAKFKREGRADQYENFDLSSIEQFGDFLANQSDLKGFNVTIPYKEAIIPFLNELSSTAQEIGAVNTVVIKKDGALIGHNTDHLGFSKSLLNWGLPDHKKAMVLGTGGAAKAVNFALRELGFEILQVSRNAGSSKMTRAQSDPPHQILTYKELTPEIIAQHLLIVNCTPLGTFPNVDQAPDVSFSAIGPQHALYDLIYNPEFSLFLTRGKQSGARVKNGLEMLEIQAIEAWELWQKDL